jgi:hypothetical protein
MQLNKKMGKYFAEDDPITARSWSGYLIMYAIVQSPGAPNYKQQ